MVPQRAAPAACDVRPRAWAALHTPGGGSRHLDRSVQLVPALAHFARFGTQVTGGVCGNSALAPVQAAQPTAAMIGSADIGAIARDWAASLTAQRQAQGPEPPPPPPPAYPPPNSAAAYANAASKAAEESQAAIAASCARAKEEAAAREESRPRGISAPKVTVYLHP